MLISFFFFFFFLLLLLFSSSFFWHGEIKDKQKINIKTSRACALEQAALPAVPPAVRAASSRAILARLRPARRRQRANRRPRKLSCRRRRRCRRRSHCCCCRRRSHCCCCRRRSPLLLPPLLLRQPKRPSRSSEDPLGQTSSVDSKVFCLFGARTPALLVAVWAHERMTRLRSQNA